VTTMEHLTEKDLVRILLEPRNALVRQYQKFFEMEDARLEFTPGALELIAHKANEKETGARGLRAIIENLMLDLMYELPARRDVDRYVIDEAVIRGEANAARPGRSRAEKKRDTA